MRLGLIVMFLNVFHCLYFTEPSTGGNAEGGAFDRRLGRRSRKQKSSTNSSDGKNQPMSCEMENIEVGISMFLFSMINFCFDS